MGIVGLPPIVRFIGIEFAIECSHSGIGFLTVLVIIQVLRVEQEFVFALRIGRIVVPCPLIIVGPLCQQHVKLHVGSFFLWNQTIVYHFILYARAYGIVFVQSLHRDGYEIGGVFELAPHRFEIFGFDIERALVAVFLIQYVLEIDTLDAGTIGRVDKFVIRLFALIDGRDFTAAVPVIVRLAHHGQFHARSVADIQIANGKVHIHREQLLGTAFGYGEHGRNMGTVVLVGTVP